MSGQISGLVRMGSMRKHPVDISERQRPADEQPDCPTCLAYPELPSRGCFMWQQEYLTQLLP